MVAPCDKSLSKQELEASVSPDELISFLPLDENYTASHVCLFALPTRRLRPKLQCFGSYNVLLFLI